MTARLKHRIVVDVLFSEPVTDIIASRAVRRMLSEQPIHYNLGRLHFQATAAKSFVKVLASEKLREA